MEGDSQYRKIHEYYRIWIGFIVVFLLLFWIENFQYSDSVLLKWCFIVAFWLGLMHSVSFVVDVGIERVTLKEFIILNNKKALIINILIIIFCLYQIYSFSTRAFIFLIAVIPTIAVIYFFVLLIVKKFSK